MGDHEHPVRKERRDAAEHRQQILLAARQLFETHGVERTNMREIARAADVGQGTLYRRFAHKGDLCLALLRDAIEALQADIEAALAADPCSAALDQLDVLFQRLVVFNEQNGALFGAIIDSAAGPRRTDYFHSAFYTWTHTIIVRLLERAVVDGEAQPLDVRLAAHMLSNALPIDLYVYMRRELGYTPEQILASLRRLLFEGLCAR